MTEQSVNMPPVKLGLAVSWAALWTGIPVKIVIVLLLLAAGLHPWEPTGLAFLLLLSMPIDIWAVGLCARTVFLDRLRMKPPEGLGIALWWKGMLLNLLYFPLAYFIESQTKAVARAVTGHIMEIEFVKAWGVAERISIELTLWGSVATAMLVLLVLGWLFLFGTIVARHAASAQPSDASYQALIRQWDLMRVPADQPLLLTAFTASGVLLVLLLWGFMPATTPHPHEQYKKEAVKAPPPIKPTEVLLKSEKLLMQAEGAVQALEEQRAKEEAEQSKNKGKAKGKAETAGVAQAKPGPTKP
ncbi:MAG: hypothetical protein ACKOCD_02705 [Nitrospiraceae bacterium]